MAILNSELERKVILSHPTQDRTFLKAFDPGVPVLCDLCQTEFSLISIHKKIVHSGSKEYKCAFCGKPFVSRKRLLEHLDAHSDGSDLFCCVCLCEQKSDDALSAHLETHTELHVLECPKCRRTFASKFCINSHDCVANIASSEVEPNKCSSENYVRTDEEIEIRLPVPEDESYPTDALLIRTPTEVVGGLEGIGCGKPRLFVSSATSNCEMPLNQSVNPCLNSTGKNERDVEQPSPSSPTEITATKMKETLVIKGEEGSESVIIEYDEPSAKQCILKEIGGVRDSVKVEFHGNQEPGDSEHNQHSLAHIAEIEIHPHHESFNESCTASNRNVDAMKFDMLNGIVNKSCGKVEFNGHQETIIAQQNSLNDSVTMDFHSELSSSPLTMNHDTGGSALPETPPTCNDDRGGHINLGQCPFTTVGADTTNPHTFDGKLRQEAALPTDLTAQKEVPEESCTDSKPAVGILAEESLAQRTRRSSRKRPYAASAERLRSEDVLPSGVQTFEEPVDIHVADSVEPTPPDSPSPRKKKNISFNEHIEYWNPILQERAWLDITEEFPEVREVPLLKVSPSKSRKKNKKKSKKKKKKGSKSKHSKHTKKEIDEEDTPELASPSRSALGAVSCDGLSTPTRPAVPLQLRPVLKPSPSPQVAVPPPDVTASKRIGRWGADSKSIFRTFGPDFSYKKCLKVDGRFHCPDEDCADNKDRGFSTDKGLRHHIRQNHIETTMFVCKSCGKSFPSQSKLKLHEMAHNAPGSYSCSVCDKKFKTKMSAKAHLMLHEQPWTCYHCGQRFSRKESLRVHLRTTECPCCKVVLRCAEVFRQHETDIPHLYQCTECDKTLKTLQIFNWHVRIKHYDKSTALDGTWLCNICDRKFTSRAMATRHARVKHGTCTRGTDQQKTND